MPNPSESKWPSYSLGPEKHIHALGVVAVNYNSLEIALDRLIHMYLKAEDEAHALIFKALNSGTQIALFKLCVTKGEADPDVRERLLHFATCYDVCFANRNLLMHSLVHADLTTDEIISLAKKSGNKPHIFNQMELTLPELRSIADEMRTLFVFAADTLLFIRRRNRQRDQPSRDGKPLPLPALPDKPAPPTNLGAKLQPNS